MGILFNPAVISIIILCILCLKRINVLLAIMISTLVAGVISGYKVQEIMSIFISGMGNNAETALSYILLGAFAATMAHSGVTSKVSEFITKFRDLLDNEEEFYKQLNNVIKEYMDN